VKYRDLSVASRSIICRCGRQRQIIDLRDTDKSRYLAKSSSIIVLSFNKKLSCTFRHSFSWLRRRTVRSNPAMDVLKWPTLEERRRKSVFKLLKKCLQGQCPQYFKEYFKRNNTTHARATRQSNLLHPPAVRTEIAKRSFYYYGCILFNELS